MVGDENDRTGRALDRVVTVANGKGGAGKTTVATHLAGLAAAAGWRVLLLDLDPQGNCGHDLGYGWPMANGTSRTDNGAHLLDALVGGSALKPVLADVRPGLDVICGGESLDDIEDVVIGRIRRSARGGNDTRRLLADALTPLAGDYDLLVMDTPPTRPTLLQLALAATRWIVVPTRPDRSSIEGLRTLATQVVAARETNPDIEILGAVLFDADTRATAVRRNAVEDIEAVLDGAGPLFEATVRHAVASAVEAREKGLLAHELASRVGDAEPFWKALKEGRRPERQPGSASALAADYALVCHEALTRIAAAEADS